MEENTAVCPKCGAPVPAGASEGLCPRCLLAVASTPTDPGTEGGVRPGARRLAEIPAVARVAAAFPQLEVVELIGVGGMGAVFKARQPKLDRWVALKLLPEAAARESAFAERFLREARTLARLSHPHIVAVHDFGQADGFFYLLMEYVDGVNLRQAMRAGRFTPAQALTLVPQICEALQFAHDRGVMHRDIKPENILLDAAGRAKLADFGIAKLLGTGEPEPGLTVTGAAVGTPQYMAPEQIEHPGEVDHRADIYSLGVVFYELLTGELPLGRFAPPSSKTPLDARLDEIVLRALAKERELRQQSANEVRTAVEQVAVPKPDAGEEAESRATDGEPPGSAPLWRTSLRFRWVTLSVLVAYAVTMVFEMQSRGGSLLERLGSGLGGGLAPVSVLTVSVGLLAWAFAYGLRREEAWLGPLALPRGGTAGADGSGVIDRGIRFSLLFLLLCFVATAANHWLSAAVSLGWEIRTGTGITAVPLVLILSSLSWAGAWYWGWRRYRRDTGIASGPLPVWTQRVAFAFTGFGLMTAISLVLTRGGEVVILQGTGEFVLPTVLALWTRSRFWRGFAQVLNACAFFVSLAGSATLAWFQWHGWPEITAHPGDPGEGVHGVSRVGAMVGEFQAAVVFGLAWWSLRGAAIRRAFGCGTGTSTETVAPVAPVARPQVS